MHILIPRIHLTRLKDNSTSVCPFSPALKVVIDISYTPPEEGYQPPYYRAASHVTLTCRAVGASGQIRYRWTSTCSSCSVPGGYYYSNSGSSRNLILRSRNAGTHHCFAYDSVRGISGNASTVMNIIGEHSDKQYSGLIPRLPHSRTQTLKLCRRGEPGIF